MKTSRPDDDRKTHGLFIVCMLMFLIAAPLYSYAQDLGAAANAACKAFCIMKDLEAKEKNMPMLKCKNAGMSTMGCSGGPVGGMCEDYKCKATNAPGQGGGNALDPGMAKLGEMLGKLMESLMKGGGGGGGGGGGQPPTDPSLQNPDSAICTTMQPTSDQTLLASNPACYYYQPGATGGGTTNTDPSGGLVATPNGGAAPLPVIFGFMNGTTGCNTPVLVLDFGDGASEQAQVHSSATCSVIQESSQHTYTTAGTYNARLKNMQTGDVRGGVNLIVTDAMAGTTGGTGGTDTTNPLPNTPTDGTGGTGTDPLSSLFSGLSSSGGFSTPLSNLGDYGSLYGSASTGGSSSTGGSGSTGGSNGTGESGGVGESTSSGTSASSGGTNSSSSPLNFNTPQSIVQSIIAKSLPPGAYGDVKILNNGTTIIAGVRDSNSEVAGFFGSNSAGGGQGAVSKMCANRPWASNFLSYVVPPAFFDSLCTWRGYTVGKPAATTTTTGTTKSGTTGTFNPTPAAKPPAKPATTTPSNAAKVDIWASPATVPLGARTSIFWTSEGVTDCIETSPDGGFTHTSLKGGASTVPLTAPTVFTISCVGPNGKPVVDSVTVQIAI